MKSLFYRIAVISMAYSWLVSERTNDFMTFSLWQLYTFDIELLNRKTYFEWCAITIIVSFSKIVGRPKRCNFRTSLAFCDEEKQKTKTTRICGLHRYKYRFNSLYQFYVESYGMSICEYTHLSCIEIVRNQRLSRRVDQMAGLRLAFFGSKIFHDIIPIRCSAW